MSDENAPMKPRVRPYRDGLSIVDIQVAEKGCGDLGHFLLRYDNASDDRPDDSQVADYLDDLPE